jgi:hypothetical protein
MARIWGSIKGEEQWDLLMNYDEPFADIQRMILNTYHGKVKWPYGPGKKQEYPTIEQVWL